MKPTLTIAICTFNREELLKYCLESLICQTADETEVLVIDNGTSKVNRLVQNYPEVRYVSESNTGLSFARNRAIKEAKGDWIMYIDDDAKSHENLISRSLEHCKLNHNVFGGVYYPWYHYGQPKWYKTEYGSNSKNFAKSGKLPKHEFLSGGIMCIHKEVFDTIGLFDTNLGMTGTKTGYGEESELQERMINANISRVYDSTLIIKHVVAPYKLSVDWFLKSNKNRGEDMAKYQTGTITINALMQIIIGFGVFIKDILIYTPQFLFVKNYYKENWKIDVLRKVYKRIGFISYSLK